MDRRHAVATLAGAAAATALRSNANAAGAARPARPNILWISCEDTSCDLGCYGEPYAVTPHLDRLAAGGVRYTHAFGHAGVCAPVRSGIITGCYPTTIGTHHMRCSGVPPAAVRCFPESLRAAGYYCTNNVKTDYQFAPPASAWDENSRQAHWRNRPDPAQPFFSIFNITTTHESQIRNNTPARLQSLERLSPAERHDPEQAVLPPYYPDTPLVRRDWARYHDLVTLMDQEAGAILAELAADGLLDNTIVWFWGDHGRGLPRGKRWLYDSGIQFPLIVSVPEQWREEVSGGRPEELAPGTVNSDLVAYLDFAPTVLALAGVPRPDHLQGQAFLGPDRPAPRTYIHAARDRMDETYDLIRGVRDRRYKYIRNYLPHLMRGQALEYGDQMPTMQEWRRLHAAGLLTGAQLQYFEPTKPVEELYDCEADPHEIHNLAGEPAHQATLVRLRAEHRRHMAVSGDVGLICEPEWDELKRPGGRMQRTSAPGATPEAGGFRLHCATPGASLVYQRPGERRWQLVTGPLAPPPGETWQAKACRIGFADSEPIALRAGEAVAAQPGPTTPLWTEVLDASDLREQLLALKQSDTAAPADLLEACRRALGSRHAAVRYRAVESLRIAARLHGAAWQRPDWVRPVLSDPAPAVRGMAAWALAEWTADAEAASTLLALLDDPSDSVRLLAMTAIDDQRQLVPACAAKLKSMANDPADYVKRVRARIVGRG